MGLPIWPVTALVMVGTILYGAVAGMSIGDSPSRWASQLSIGVYVATWLNVVGFFVLDAWPAVSMVIFALAPIFYLVAWPTMNPCERPPLREHLIATAGLCGPIVVGSLYIAFA